jgi:tRNA uridine 5-carbamoylmethylation protein Kti12
MKNCIIIIRGAAASGKTTIAKKLCKRFSKSFHIDVDTIRHFDPNAKPILKELTLSSKAAAALSNIYSSAGYAVIIDSTFITQELLDTLLKNLKSPKDSIFLFTLKPALKELIVRDRSRAKFKRLGDKIKVIYYIGEKSRERRGIFIDNSKLSVKETVDIIIDNIKKIE